MKSLGDEAQHRLIKFLTSQLELGPTFVLSALLAHQAGDLDHYAEAKPNATKVAETVRQSINHIEDVQVRTKIGEHLAELDRLISTK
jgi:hypothetical protein